ncbi:hypothetical protein GALL_233620 [mine drainage metagenome]|uniref:Uncharacterized protein n=1 Tax=mine drainage metagenome TaxID=410659 RepID=A0A1J5RF15_9ZZZZ
MRSHRPLGGSCGPGPYSQDSWVTEQEPLARPIRELSEGPPLLGCSGLRERIGEELVRLLLEVIDGQEPAAITLPTALVVRVSA